MSTSIDFKESNYRFPLTYLSGTYTILVATLYLWGYWSQFGINILEHLSIADVVKSAAYPIASIFVFYALGVFIASSDNRPPSSEGTADVLLAFIRKHPKKTIAIFLSVFLIALVFGPVEKWQILPCLIAVPISLSMSQITPPFSLIKSESARNAITLILVSMPPFAFGTGLVKANHIINGKEYLYVVSNAHASKSRHAASPSYQLRYIGKANDRYFLYSPETESVLIIPDDGVLELKAFKSENR